MFTSKKKLKKPLKPKRRIFRVGAWSTPSFNLRVPLGLSAFILIIVSGWFIMPYLKVIYDRFHTRCSQLATQNGLVVNDIFIEGHHYTLRSEILRNLKIERGAPILSFKPEEIKKRLEQLPWVRSALIQRRLPDIIYVRIVEWRPIAIWRSSKQSKSFLVNEEGSLIGEADLKTLDDLIKISGNNAPFHAPSLRADLDTVPGLAKHIVGAAWIGNRRWDLLFDNGVRAKLPEENVSDALTYLNQLNEKHTLIHRHHLESIDLRTRGQIIVTMTPGTSPHLQIKGNHI